MKLIPPLFRLQSPQPLLHPPDPDPPPPLPPHLPPRVARAALHLVAPGRPPPSPPLGPLDRLAVDVAGLRVNVAAGGAADAHAQGGGQLPPGAVVAPGAEVVVDGLPRDAEVVGDGSPGTPLAVVVEEGVEHLAQVA